VEKFGKNLELLLEQNPAKDEDQENPENGRDPLVAEDDQNVNVVVNQVEETMNNTTRLNRKRPLFSQTCNTLLEDEEQGNSKESPVRNSNVPKTPIAEEDSDEDLFATPKGVTKTLKVANVESEIEITKIDESPMSSSSLDTTEEILISGNVEGAPNAGKGKKGGRGGRTRGGQKPDPIIDDTGSESSEELFPTTSTQIEPPTTRRSGRLSRSSRKK